MSEPETKPSTSRVQLQPTTPEKTPTGFTPNLAKRMQDDTCYLCHQKGHWSWFCPLKSKSPNSKTLFSPSPTRNDSPVSPNSIRCRCGHGFCEIRTSSSHKNPNRKYFACPIKRGARCREFVKWCDDGIDESDLQPPPFKYPECECGAGVCRRVKQELNTDAVKYYFVCPVKRDHGSCGYRVSEEDLLNSGNGSIVPIQQSRQRTLHEFFGSDQNEKTGGDLGEGDYLLVHTKRTRIMDSSENPLSVAVSEIPEEEDAGAVVRVPASEHVGFPEFEVADEDLEFVNSVSWETIEAEAFSSSRPSTSRIQWQQKIDKSMENSITMEERNRLFEEEKMRFSQLQDDYHKTKALLEKSNHQKLLLYEQVSNLKAMLREKQEQLESCELETLKIETHLGDLTRSMLEADITLKERGEQTELARKQSEKRQEKQIAANAALEKAKHITEN